MRANVAPLITMAVLALLSGCAALPTEVPLGAPTCCAVRLQQGGSALRMDCLRRDLSNIPHVVHLECVCATNCACHGPAPLKLEYRKG
jgi:hypothetical protein